MRFCYSHDKYNFDCQRLGVWFFDGIDRDACSVLRWLSRLTSFFPANWQARSLTPVLEARPRINAIHKELLAGHIGKVFAIILLLRLSVTPFAGTNYLISASGVSFGTYFWATITGYIPRTAAAVFVGTSIERLNFGQPRESWLLFLTIGATIAVMILMSILAKRALNRLTEQGCRL